MVRALQSGESLKELMDGDIYAVRAVSKVCDIADFDEFIKAYSRDAHAC